MSGLREGCAERCPGCTHRHLGAEASEARKTAWLARALTPWRERIAPLRAVPETARWGYRDKVSLAATWDGAWHFGMTRRDEVVPIPRCPVHTERVRDALRVLAGSLPPAAEFPLARYVQSGAQGTLILKTGRRPDTAWVRSAGPALASTGLEGLWLHMFPALGRRTFQKRGWELLWGRPASRDGAGLLHGPTAFRQPVPRLYTEALDEAEFHLAPDSSDLVADLYCGAGASLRRWLRRGARVLGIEADGEAVACAAPNAPGAEVLRGSCETRLPQLADAIEDVPPDRRLVYANPPRTGMEAAVSEWIAGRCRPPRMAYLSCSAGTLRRDLRMLEKGGMEVERITPYDFFPQTHHVETLVLLSRQHR